MKKFLLFAAIVVLAGGCKKDKSEIIQQEQTYEQRILGTWDLSAVSYYAELPPLQPGSPPTPIEGEGEGVSGTFMMKKNPNVVEYDFSFTAQATFLGQTIPMPLNQQGKGIWTISSNETKIFIELENGEVSILEVVENLEDKQVFSTEIPFEIPVLGVINVDAVITFVR